VKRQVSTDEFINVAVAQDERSGSWNVVFRLLGSRRRFKARFSFDPSLAETIGIDVPKPYRRTNELYDVGESLSTDSPLRVSLKARRIVAGQGLVYFQFECKAALGGSIVLQSVPIGLADPGKLDDFVGFHERRLTAWRARQGE
jgi:hypothetical protein